MALIDPGTRSPGHVFVQYTHQGKQRTFSMRLQAGVDPSMITAIKTDLEPIAAFFAACMPLSSLIYGFGLKGNDGSVRYRGFFDTAKPGLRGVSGGQLDWLSTTITLQGRGGAIAFGDASGVALTRFHIGGIVPMLPGSKYVSLALTGTYFTDLQTALNLDTKFFADFYGQKADVSDRAPIQFNAHTQAEDGC